MKAPSAAALWAVGGVRGTLYSTSIPFYVTDTGHSRAQQQGHRPQRSALRVGGGGSEIRHGPAARSDLT